MNRPRYEIEAYSVVSNISYTVNYSRQCQALKRLSAKGITQRPRVYTYISNEATDKEN